MFCRLIGSISTGPTHYANVYQKAEAMFGLPLPSCCCSRVLISPSNEPDPSGLLNALPFCTGHAALLCSSIQIISSCWNTPLDTDDDWSSCLDIWWASSVIKTVGPKWSYPILSSTRALTVRWNLVTKSWSLTIIYAFYQPFHFQLANRTCYRRHHYQLVDFQSCTFSTTWDEDVEAALHC